MTCTLRSRRASGPAATAATGAILSLLIVLASPRAFGQPSVAPLRPETGSFIGVLDSINASILTLVAVPEGAGPNRPGVKRKRLIGTGVVSSERRIVTTASLALPNGSVRVLLGGGQERPVFLRGVDRLSNIAVFEVDDPLLKSLRRAPPQSLAVGTWVAVLSNVAITRPQAALGRVVGRGERVDFAYSGDVLEIDAPAYPGSTGGAVVNEDGEWVAVVVGRATPLPPESGARVGGSGDAASQANSVLIALPVDQVDRIADDLVEFGTVRRGFLGVRLKIGPPAPEDTLGVRVDGVIPGSPAASAGIRRGDRILALEGQEVRAAGDITLIVHAMRPGDDVEVTVLREAEILPVRVVLGSTAEAPRAGGTPERARQIQKLRQDLLRVRAEAQALEERLRSLESEPPASVPDR
jgi:S1-C subfamily serine protease